MINNHLLAVTSACNTCINNAYAQGYDPSRICQSVCNFSGPAAGSGYRSVIGNPILPTLSALTGVQIISGLLPVIVGAFFVIGSIGFFFMLLIGAIQWIFSGGDKGAIEGAKGRITNAFIGIVVLFSTFALVKIVETLFGVNILTIDIGPLKIQ